jgi:pheromone shutdown-related protein TraB
MERFLEHSDVHRLTSDGREIILIGTAHVSRESADLVEEIIGEIKPDTVCIELCKSRLETLRNPGKWLETDIVKVIREKRTSLLLSQLLMASLQKRIAEKFKINPGEEMRRAVRAAGEIGAEIVPADREIRITLTRTWRKMRFWSKFMLLPDSIASLVMSEDISMEDIEKLKKRDALEIALDLFGKKMPEIKTTLIDERDQYLAHFIGHAPGSRIVAVVGAGHVPGILSYMGKDIDIDALNRIPPKGRLGDIIQWGLLAGVAGLFIGGFFYAGSQASINMAKWWIGITSLSAALGALVVLAHPLTIAAAALSAPIATIHPLIATGWVAGLTEASLRKPQVKDFLDLADDITTFRGFWRNKITRLLLLVAIVNLAAAAGTFIAIPVMARFLYP